MKSIIHCSVLLLSILLSACVETEVGSPTYYSDSYPKFTSGVIPLENGEHLSYSNYEYAVNLPLDTQGRKEIENALKYLEKSKTKYTLTAEAIDDVISNTSLIFPQRELFFDDFLNSPGKYVRFQELHEQKLELEVALDAIAKAYGKTRDDKALLSSQEFFKTFVSYLAVYKEMERIVDGY